MKKKLLGIVMAVFAMTMMFTSCSKAEKLIVGTWTNTANSNVKITANGEEIANEVFNAGEVTMVFNEDGTCNEGATYTIDDDKLTITYKGENIVYDVVTLEKKLLVLENIEKQTQYGTELVVSTHMEMEKQ